MNGYANTNSQNSGWGSGGAGYRGNGLGSTSHTLNSPNAFSFQSGGAGGSGYYRPDVSCEGQAGGFGGGGSGSCNGAGGAGGYSGGGQGGGGGGSGVHTNAQNRINIGYNSGNGYAKIELLEGMKN